MLVALSTMVHSNVVITVVVQLYGLMVCLWGGVCACFPCHGFAHGKTTPGGGSSSRSPRKTVNLAGSLRLLTHVMSSQTGGFPST